MANHCHLSKAIVLVTETLRVEDIHDYLFFRKKNPIYKKLQLLFQSEQLASESKVISMCII